MSFQVFLVSSPRWWTWQQHFWVASSKLPEGRSVEIWHLGVQKVFSWLWKRPVILWRRHEGLQPPRCEFCFKFSYDMRFRLFILAKGQWLLEVEELSSHFKNYESWVFQRLTVVLLSTCICFRNWASVVFCYFCCRIIPESAHSAYDKAAQYFNIKLRRAPVDTDLRADVRAMKRLINKNTIMVSYFSCFVQTYVNCYCVWWPCVVVRDSFITVTVLHMLCE